MNQGPNLWEMLRRLEKDVEGEGCGETAQVSKGTEEWAAGPTRIPAKRITKWISTTAATQKGSQRSWLMRTGGSSGACDKGAGAGLSRGRTRLGDALDSKEGKEATGKLRREQGEGAQGAGRGCSPDCCQGQGRTGMGGLRVPAGSGSESQVLPRWVSAALVPPRMDSEWDGAGQAGRAQASVDGTLTGCPSPCRSAD